MISLFLIGIFIAWIIDSFTVFITLKTGDLIYTGTPAGVGPIQIGDKLEGNLNGNKLFEFTVK